MKNRIILFSLALLFPSIVWGAPIDLKLKDVTVQDAIASVSLSENYSIIVKSSDVDMNKSVSIDASDASITEVLDQIFAGQNVSYTIVGRTISVSRKQEDSRPAEKEAKLVEGVVTDESGEPLMGASVLIKGTTSGVITDFDGKFKAEGLKFPVTLVFSFIGLDEQEITFNASESGVVVALKATNTLEDVVVVGYGTQKRVNLTGAVAVIDGKDINNRPVSNAAAALQGADPSLLLTNASGSIEGNGQSISIRGAMSLSSGKVSPLVLVDGVEGSLTQVNPNDIESISVLKDASACAIYGARASAGVVLVNTKSGQSGEAKITYNGRFSVSTNTTSTEFMTCSYDYVNFTNEFYQVLKGVNAWLFTDEQMAMLEARRNDKTENPDRPWVFADDSGRYTWMYAANFDWYGYLFKRERPETEHNVTVRGGNDKIQYFVSGRYLYREGVMNANSADYLNNFFYRSKIDAKLTDWARVSSNVSFTRSLYDYGGFCETDGNEKTGAYPGAHSAFYNANQNIGPFFTPYNPDGSIVITPGFMADNEASQIGTGRVPAWSSDKNKNNKTRNGLTILNRLTIDLSDAIKANVDYTYRRNDNLIAYRCLPIEGYNNVSKQFYANGGYTSGAIYDFYREQRSYMDSHILNAYLSYTGHFGRHSIAATAGTNYDHYRESALTIMQKGSLSEDLAYINMSGGDITTAAESNSAYKTLGFFGRVNYDFAGRYLLELSGRYDGTSRFASDSRWGFFPSASAGWRLSEEEFWTPLKGWWNNAKVRLSYGTLGNQVVSNYYYLDTINIGQLTYTFDGTNKSGYASISDPKSDNLTWETVVSYNLGIDLGFLRDRLNINSDFYIRDTKDMLTTSITLPSSYGASSPKENAADLRTRGYEISVSWKDHFKVGGENLSYGITATLGDYLTKVTKYNNPTNLLSDYYVGKTIGEIWGYTVSGLFKSDEEAEEYSRWIDDKAVNAGIYNCKAPYNKLMAGDPIFEDLDESQDISSGSNTLADPGDRRVIGNSLPRYLYSLRGDLSFHGFDFNIFFQGVGKCDWMPNEACDYFWVTYRNQRPTFIPVDFEKMCWSEDNTDAYFPRRRSQIAHTSFNKANSYYLQNCAYLRLKNVSIGYTVPLKSRVIEKCRVYVNGENLAYWSPLKKHCLTIDPEVATTGAVNDCMYPYSKTFSVGVDITF